MAIYKYNGKIDFIKKDLNLYVKPGEIFSTDYVLPYEWSDFELIDINDGNTLIQHTTDYSVSDIEEVDVKGYNSLIIILKNNSTSVLGVCFGHESNLRIILNNYNNTWLFNKTLLYSFDRIFLKHLNGDVCNVVVYFGLTNFECYFPIIKCSGGDSTEEDTSQVKISVIAGEPITKGQVVYFRGDDRVYVADADNEDVLKSDVAIAMENANTGDNLDVILYGKFYNSGWTLNPLRSYFLGNNGNITDIVPSDGVVIKLGTAEDGQTLIFQPKIPIKRD